MSEKDKRERVKEKQRRRERDNVYMSEWHIDREIGRWRDG